MEIPEVEFKIYACVKMLITPSEAKDILKDFEQGRTLSPSTKNLVNILQRIADSDE